VKQSDDGEILRQRLREVREYLNLTQQFVSDQTGIARSAIAEIESGKRRVESTELKKLARLYRHPVSYFLGEDDPLPATDSPIMHALARATGELTDEDRREVLRYAQFLRFYTRPPSESDQK
jgi:transcriptional regulator with XRE-family HTH domain